MWPDAGRNKRREAEIFALIDAGFDAFFKGDHGAAVQSADRILALQGDQVDALYLKGQVAHRQEHLEAAQDYYERAVLARPGFIDPYLRLIALLLTTGHNDDALAVWQYALAQVRPSPEALADLCAPLVENFAARVRETLEPALRAGNAPAKAWSLYQQVLHRLQVDGAEYDDFLARMRAQFPGTPELAAAEAMGLSYRDRIDAAEAAHAAMREKFPHLLFFDGELARAYRDSGRSDSALAQAEQFAQLLPDQADYAFMIADLKLRRGEIAEGLALNEKRFARELGFNWKHLGIPEWKGEPLAGRKIVVFEEQGLGDCIMFGRYLPVLLAHGARVMVACRPAVYPLFAAQPSLRKAEIVDRSSGISLGGVDYYVAALSVAHCLGIAAATAGDGAAYLQAGAARTAAWRGQLSRDGRLLAGVAWAANLSTGIGNAKSIPAGLMPGLLGHPDLAGKVAFVSLQVPAALDAPHRQLYAATPAIADFADTMALIDCMDLVISVDTSVAHLAASMGKRTIVMSKFAPDWRWAAPPDGAPYWYRQAEVIRQDAPRDWESAVGRLVRHLSESKPG